jgi:hypothetical protein
MKEPWHFAFRALLLMLGSAVACEAADPHALPSEVFTRRWSAAVWTETGEAAQWQDESAREYCGRFAEQLVAQWSRLAKFPRSTVLRLTLRPGAAVSIEANPEPFWKPLNPCPLDSLVLERAITAALPPLPPPMSRERRRILQVAIAFDASSQDNVLFRIMGQPVAGFPVP